MIGSLFAGTEESRARLPAAGPFLQGYRGMGSIGAMARGSQTATSRQGSGHAEAGAGRDRRPGPYKGPLAGVVHQLVGGLGAAMGYVGATDLAELRTGPLRPHLKRRPAGEPSTTSSSRAKARTTRRGRKELR